MTQRSTSNDRREVVITGIGAVTPIGIGVEAMWDSLMAGRSGVGALTHFDPGKLPVSIAAEVTDFDAADFIDRREIGRNDRFTHLAVAAARLAVEHAEIESFDAPPERVGVIVGSGIGGIGTIEREKELFLERGPRAVSPFTVPKLMPNAAAAAIAMKHGLKGINYAPSSACATGAHALGEAYRAIKDGVADVMLAGGTEAAITPLSVAAFCRMQALSTRNDDPERAAGHSTQTAMDSCLVRGPEFWCSRRAKALRSAALRFCARLPAMEPRPTRITSRSRTQRVPELSRP